MVVPAKIIKVDLIRIKETIHTTKNK